jgi:hypothetical protein
MLIEELSDGLYPRGMKVRFLLISFLLLVPCSRAQTRQPLKGLQQVEIAVEEIGKLETDIGLTKEVLESQALVALRRDIPALKISRGSMPFLYVNVLAAEAGYGVAVHVSVALSRPARILMTPIRMKLLGQWLMSGKSLAS